MIKFFPRPELEQECQGMEECTGTWFTTIWSQCTVSCGGGTNKRNVMCLHNGEPVDPGQCDAEAMPASDGDCNVEDCPEASGDEEPADAQPEYSDGKFIKYYLLKLSHLNFCIFGIFHHFLSY